MHLYQLDIETELVPGGHQSLVFQAPSDEAARQAAIQHAAHMKMLTECGLDRIAVRTVSPGEYDPATGLFGTSLDRLVYDSDDAVDDDRAEADAELQTMAAASTF